MRIQTAGMLLLVAGFSAHAQGPDSVRRATISGSRGASGKCTIEVRVDISAEVDISGDSGRLRTLAGQPATWTRMECTDPLPAQMSDFRFKGVDGRGQMRLVQDPRNNRSVAVIHIEDPKGGAEGYTFDIEWSGASGGPSTGFDNGPPRGLPSTTRGPVRGSNRRITDEQAIDACRAELRDRGGREYGLRNIDVSSAKVSGREEVTGTFQEGNAVFRRGNPNPYRFTCSVDYNSGQVRSLDILRPDGGRLERGSGAGSGGPGPADSSRALRACQDAVVARSNRDGYQNVNFTTTAIDPRRNDSITGTLTARRGPVADSFDFTCSMDGNAGVKNVDLRRH